MGIELEYMMKLHKELNELHNIIEEQRDEIIELEYELIAKLDELKKSEDKLCETNVPCRSKGKRRYKK